MSANKDIGTVVFEDVLDQYTAEKDVFVAYRVKKNFSASRDDWVGIFPEYWMTLDDAVAVHNVPKPSKRNRKIKHKGVLFTASSFKVVPDCSDRYQFVYVTKDRRVLGLSKLLSFCEDPETCLDAEPATLETPEQQPENITPEAEPSCEAPDATTTPDFTVTPSGTTMLNQFDLLMDQELRGYLENPEKALVPFCPVFGPELPEWDIFQPQLNFDLQCILDTKKDMPWLEELAELLCSPSPQATQITPPITPTPSTTPSTPKSAGCHNCHLKQRQIRAMKEKLHKTKRAKRRVTQELYKTREAFVEKDFELDAECNQLCKYKKENADLSEKPDLQTHQIAWLTSEHDRTIEELNESIRLYRKEKSRASDLTEQVTVLKGEKENLEMKYLMADTDREFQEGENTFLKGEVIYLQDKTTSLESTIDDIMFTLSILGYTRIIYPDGRVADLTKSTGSCMELLGVAHAKQEDASELLAKKDDEIAKLKDELNGLKTELAEQENNVNSLVEDLQEVTEFNDFLMEKSNEMAEDLFEAAEKEAALYNQLVDERRLTWLSRMGFQPLTNLDAPLIEEQEEEEPTLTKNVGTNTKVTHIVTTSALPKPKSEQILSKPTVPEEQPRQGYVHGIDSSMLQLGNLFKESETNTATPQAYVHGVDSSLLQHGVLGKLFKESETNTLRPQLSTILQGRVLNKLFKEPKQEPVAKGSAVFKDNVLKNLFKKSSSNVSVANLLRENSFAAMPVPQGSECLLECRSTVKDSCPSLTQVQGFPPYSLKTLAQLKRKGVVWTDNLDAESFHRLFNEEDDTAACTTATTAPRKMKKRSKGRKSRKCNKQQGYGME